MKQYANLVLKKHFVLSVLKTVDNHETAVMHFKN